MYLNDIQATFALRAGRITFVLVFLLVSLSPSTLVQTLKLCITYSDFWKEFAEIILQNIENAAAPSTLDSDVPEILVFTGIPRRVFGCLESVHLVANRLSYRIYQSRHEST